MTLIVTNSLREQVSLEKFEFVEELNGFNLKFGIDEVFLNYPISLSKEHNPDDFLLYHLSNIALNAENDIFQVYEEKLDKRIGWIFPIQSLMSTEHDHSNNKFFLNYAFIAYNLLIAKGNQINNIPSLNMLNETCSLFDFFPDDLSILIISKKTIEEIKDFDIKDYLPYLSKYGYFQYSNNSKEITYASNSVANLYQTARAYEKIKITRIASKYKSNPFIDELYANLLYSSRHHLLIFHYLYQVIEYLIDENFKIEFDKLIEQYKSGEIKRLDFREEITNSLNEKKRINKINELVKPNNRICEDLLIECNRFLSVVDSPKLNYVEALYKVRSLMVHEYRLIISKKELVQILETINMRFEHLIIEILVNDQV